MLFPFSSRQRLLKSSEYASVLRHSCTTLRRGCFILHILKRSEGEARLGLTITKKNIAHAVDRNRVKRIIRESFRLQGQALHSMDIVCFVKREAKHSLNAVIRKNIEVLWKKLQPMGEVSSPLSS
jgi:ribonuclease P protein component